MFLVDSLIFIAAILLLFGIFSSKFSVRVGVPFLLVFLVLGMLAGSEGIGGIQFENYPVAHAIATVALAMILFDGGLRTSIESVRMVWKPALTLATFGVLATTALTGLLASFLLDIPLSVGLLLGAIIGSTDAAAIFSVLRSAGLHLRPHVASTLEVESGANDPMAIFLTIATIEYIRGEIDSTSGMLLLLLQQGGIGAAVGYGFGRFSSFLTNRANLSAAGLYPLLITACGFLTYGLAAVLGGSGFLAVYIAGITIGARPIVFQRGIWLFHDGMAWLSQIAMFVMLGLIIFPSRLASVAADGLLIALGLTFVARPVAVAISLIPFKYTFKEYIYIAWAGLKGAVPIVLAIYPVLLLDKADVPPGIFETIFFVVLLSAATQGWSLPWLARKLGLEEPPPPTAPVSLEITSLQHVDGDIIAYAIDDRSKASGCLVRELALPETAVVAMIARENKVIPPRGSTRVKPGDHVFVVMSKEVRPMVDRVFSVDNQHAGMPTDVEFPLQGYIRIGSLMALYDIKIEADPTCSLDSLMRSRLHAAPAIGDKVQIDDVVLTVRRVNEKGQIDLVGLSMLE